MDTAESSAPKRSTVIPFCLPKRRSTCLTPPAPVSTVDKADEMILQDTLQISRSETSLKLQKSEEQRGLKENVELVKEHLASVEIEKMVDDSLLPRNDEPKIPGTRGEDNNDEVYELKRKGEERKFVADLGVEVKRKECSSRIEIKFQNFGVHPNGDQDDPLDDAHPEGENHAMRLENFEYEAYVSGESSSGQVNENEQGPSTLGNQEQEDDYDFWTESYASDDDEIPTKQMSQDIMEEVSLIIDEAKLKKMVDEMLRQRCTLGYEHQYHIDQMKEFLISVIVSESRKEILVSPHPRKTTPLIQSSQRYPEAPPLSLINQDLLYLKKGSYKFPAIIFNDDDIEERTSIWVNKCVKKFNPYAQYGVEHWKNPHAKIFYIRKQKEPRKPKEEIYSNSKIIQVIKTYWELGHEHKFITEIVARRANDCIVSITEPDYKNLNKNDIEDIYMLIMTGKKVNLTAPTITFPGIEEHDMFSIIYEPMHGIIYNNSKIEKRVMRHTKIHKFCDATLNRVLEGLKSYNNDVKYGYVQKDLTKDETEYLKLFEEEIEERLKHQRQMRRWEMFVNRRPLGLRRGP
ncbi:hypothetical protein Tco_0809975 [Tanacetum coccineum]